MKRKIEDVLKDWKDNRFQALLVTGARQIGKTYSIDRFITNSFAFHKSINFATNPSALDAFSKLGGPLDFELKVSLHAGDLPDTPQSVLFLDEIQLVYRRRDEMKEKDPTSLDKTVDPLTLIKDFCQKGRRRYVFSGSLLGVSLEGVLLDPAGYIDVAKMYPMDFEEFLWAKGIPSNVIDHCRNCFLKQLPVNEDVHKTMLSLFNEYVLIGGMPEALSSFIQDRSFTNATKSQEQIIGYYHRDIVTYASSGERLAIQEIYDTIPSEINSKNKRFKKTSIDLPNAKNLDLGDRFLWLTKAGVALPVYNASNPIYPLRLNEQRKTLKLFYSDVGILSCLLLGEEGRKKMLDGDISVNYGAPFENAVAQELSAHGYAPLHYWNNKKNGEIDFLIERGAGVLPLEIKSGKSNTDRTYNHAALNHCLSNDPSIEEAFLFSEENTFRESKRILNYPIYLIAFLHNENPNPFED